MIAKATLKASVTAKDLLKDYIDFLLVILLSFFIKYDAKEIALSIWFYSVGITYLLAMSSPFIYRGLIEKSLMLYLYSIVATFGSAMGYSFFFYIQLIFIHAGFDTASFSMEKILAVDNFIPFIPFIPFVIYRYRDYFKKTDMQDMKKYSKMLSKMFFLCFKTQFLAIISIVLGITYRGNPKISFFITYTLFFFPFLKTFKFLRHKRGT